MRYLLTHATYPGKNSHRITLMFAFYSNRLGCIGSIVISLIGTIVLGTLVWLLSNPT